MGGHDLVVRARRVVTPTGEVPARVVVTGGRITAVEPYDLPVDAARTVELADDEVLLPGLVDTHVHVDEPGRTEWEGFATATRAAAAGGITTILDMPLNSLPPTIDVDALTAKRKAAEGQCHVDVGFWGGAVPANVPAQAPGSDRDSGPRLRELHDAGVFGFKCFTLHSGVEEFPPLTTDQIDRVLAELAAFDGLLIVHAEDAETIGRAPSGSGRAYRGFLASRPPAAEDAAIAQVIELARRHNARVHILHLSSAGALPMVAAAREGPRISVETCPHYLTLTAEQIPDGATQFKCCPPVREAANRELLWKGLAEGEIDSVVSDHSPCPPELKRLDTGDFGTAWGGISSLQLGLPAVWSEARKRGHTLSDVARWMAEVPARLAGLQRKGAISVGCHADFAVFAPDEAFTVDPYALSHRHPVTPYAGRSLSGTVRATWLRGEQVAGRHGTGRQAPGEPRGRLLTRGEA